MGYTHTQTGYVILISFIAISILYTVILSQTGFILPLFVFMLLILFILGSFGSLHVAVDEHSLRIKFGYGLFQKQFPLKEIVSVKTVKNRWYYGWGIRWGPGMWIYNVSGFDALEIVIKDGKRYRIGTDEPAALEQAILQSVASDSSR